MKIYRVVFSGIYELEHTLKIVTFFNKTNALQYYKEQLEKLKKEQEELDIEEYDINEDEVSYERYLEGQAVVDSVSLWLEEENTYDELILKVEQEKQNEQDKEYEL